MMIDSSKIPLSEALLKRYSKQQALEHALTGGDDYQLAFTANAAENIFEPAVCIGRVTNVTDFGVRTSQNIDFQLNGYNHFD